MADEHSEDLQKGSDNIIGGFRQLGAGLRFYSRSLATWFDDHPVIKWVVLLPASMIIGRLMGRIWSVGVVYFYGQTVPINRDVMLGTFPVPVGLSLWSLLVGLIFLGLLTYFRLVSLRQQYEELENRVTELEAND